MAIQFARIEIATRSNGDNACCKGAYNARTKITDEKTNVVYDFSRLKDNAHHAVLLPNHVDKNFSDPAVLMNAVEHIEKKENSQLLKDVVIALPDDQELSLEDRINITHEIIDEMGWVKNGLAVQMDIHEPHDGEKNWHAHLLVTTRRFTEDGKRLGAKARDLNPEFKTGKYGNFIIPEEDIIHEKGKRIINDYCKKMGYETRVDAISLTPQEHVGPVRMRSVMNEAIYRNESVKEANIKYLRSGARVLEYVTSRMSVFSEGDIERAVKIVPDETIRDKLVSDAMKSTSLIGLYDDNGKSTGYFTTTEIRQEEEKLLRLSSYIVNNGNAMSITAEVTARKLIEEASTSLTDEQSSALSHLLLDDSGLHILRGRAGVGKSYVLGQVQRIATSAGMNVIGLAPTHKAKGELAKVGYEKNDTVKGMLFKFVNHRFDLPKGSLIVVDEAGMIGNDDYQELLRVAASRKCNVVLSGDEKQLASVQRGGMFEVFAEKYGSSTILNIQRQKEAWGRDVAMAFSEGRVKSGISILQDQKKIIESTNRDASMQRLLSDWNNSKESIVNKTILAVRNRDVNALNHGARQYLKASGKLHGIEISVAGNHYMRGDRILIKKTDKDMGVTNGDFATIEYASKEKFVIIMKGKGAGENDNSKTVEFNPKDYSGFRHGYATTVFKAQGASIKDVYVFHNGFAGIRNSYVALSRNVKDLKLYINNQATKSISQLIKQMGHDPEISSSLSYLTKKDINNRELIKDADEERGVLGSMLFNAFKFTKERITAFNDKHFVDNEYYRYRASEPQRAKVEEVLEVVAQEMESEAKVSNITLEERAVVGGNANYSSLDKNNQISDQVSGETITNKAKQTAKQRFYAKVDRSRNVQNSISSGNKINVSRKINSLERKTQWDIESERMRSEVRYKTESIARNLLGEPNKKLSDGRTLRFGTQGKVAVRISGGRMGSWFDFSTDKGGDMFALVQEKLGCDFKGAIEYLGQTIGIDMNNNSNIKLVHDHRIKDLTQGYVKEKTEEERLAVAKAERVEKLYARAKDIGSASVAYKYLTKTRGLKFGLANSNVSSNVNTKANKIIKTKTDISIADNTIPVDIKTTGIYMASDEGGLKKGKYVPALIAFARDVDGNVTGGQQIFLDKNRFTKADISVPKKSFGKVSGSFVNLGNTGQDEVNIENEVDNIKRSRITIIAEGLETALSIKQAMSEHSEEGAKTKVLCSLGIYNIKNYRPNPEEKIIIAADNDGANSNTRKIVESAKLALEEKDAFVEIVTPLEEGDFNDVLFDKKNGGSKEIREIFKPVFTRCAANTLIEYFGEKGLKKSLDNNDKANLAYIEKYDLPQGDIVDAYRKSSLDGKLDLEYCRKSLEMAFNHCNNNKDLLEEAKQWGYEKSEVDIAKSLMGADQEQAVDHCIEIRDCALNQYFKSHFNKFEDRQIKVHSLKELKPIIKEEQRFLKETYESLKSPMDQHSDENQEYLRAGKIAAIKPKELEKVFSLADRLVEEGEEAEHKVFSSLFGKKNMEMESSRLLDSLYTRKYYTLPFMLQQERRSAKNINSAFRLMEKEQDLYVAMRGKISKSRSYDKELLDKVETACVQQENSMIGNLQKTVERCLEIGAISEDAILKELKTTSDLKLTFEKFSDNIESHYINNNLNSLAEEKAKAKTPLEVLNILEKKQDYLCSIEVQIKYREYIDKEISSAIDISQKEKEDKVLETLRERTKRGLSIGAISESDIIKELQSSSDLQLTNQKISGKIESHDIKKALDEFSTEKAEVKTPLEVISILGKKQDYLCGIAKQLQYPDHIDTDIVNAISLSQSEQENKTLHSLTELTKLASNEQVDRKIIMQHLISGDSLEKTTENLKKDYQASYLQNIEKNIESFEDSDAKKIGGRIYESATEYITDTMNHSHPEYAPHAELKVLQEKILNESEKGIDFER